MADFSTETASQREWQDIFKVMKAKTCIQEHYQARLLFRFEEKIKSLIEKQELKEFITTKPALQERSKCILEVGKRSQLEI